MVGTEISKYRVTGGIAGIDAGQYLTRAGMVLRYPKYRQRAPTYLMYGACGLVDGVFDRSFVFEEEETAQCTIS